MIGGIVAGIPSAPLTSTKWRIYVHQSFDANTSVVFHEIEMRSTIGGADQCSGGTVTYSSQDSNVATNAFDNNTTTAWRGGAGPAWIAYEFLSPVEVKELALWSGGNDVNTPRWFELQYWNGTTWLTKWSIMPTSWAAESLKLFTGSTSLGPELINDPSFNDPASWTTSGGWSVSGGNLVASGASNRMAKAGILTAGKRYFVEFPYTKTGGARLRLTTQSSERYATAGLSNGSGTVRAIMQADNTELRLEAADSLFSGTIPSISVREIL